MTDPPQNFRCRYYDGDTWDEIAADSPREAAEAYALELLQGDPEHGAGTKCEVDGHGWWDVGFDWDPIPYATERSG